jgi:hypothetical protein
MFEMVAPDSMSAAMPVTGETFVSRVPAGHAAGVELW